MNFYELFEASKEKEEKSEKAGEYQDVAIADPKAAIALKQARAKYTYAQSDLEAFVKMMQDQEEKDQQEIDNLEADTERQEEEIQQAEKEIRELEKREAQDTAKNNAKINKLNKEIDLQNRLIQTLNTKEQGYEKALAQYADRIEKINADLTDLEDRMGGIKGFRARPKSKAPPLPKPSDFAVGQAAFQRTQRDGGIPDLDTE